jgi:hypothetical protein
MTPLAPNTNHLLTNFCGPSSWWENYNKRSEVVCCTLSSVRAEARIAECESRKEKVDDNKCEVTSPRTHHTHMPAQNVRLTPTHITSPVYTKNVFPATRGLFCSSEFPPQWRETQLCFRRPKFKPHPCNPARPFSSLASVSPSVK